MPSPGAIRELRRRFIDSTNWADTTAEILYQHRRWVVAALLALYVAGFNGQWRVEPDAALYLTLGRNLAGGLGYTYHGVSERIAYPGLPVLLAGLHLVFGKQWIVAAHVMMLGMALATLGLVYRLFRLHTNSPTALVITLGVGITRTFYRYAFEIRSDMPFLMAVTAFLAGFEAIAQHYRLFGEYPGAPPRREKIRWYDWMLTIAGIAMAVVTRPTMLALVAAVIGTLGYAAVRFSVALRKIVPVLVLGLALLAALAFFFVDPRRAGVDAGNEYETMMFHSVTSHLGQTLHTVLTVNLPLLLNRAVTDAMFQVRFGPFNIVLSLLLLTAGVGLIRRQLLWGLFIITTVGLITVVGPIDRYMLPIIPLLVYAWWEALRIVTRPLPKNVGRTIFVLAMALGTVVNADRVFGQIVEQRRPGFIQHYKGGMYVPLKKLATEVQQLVPPNRTILIANSVGPYTLGRIMTFYSVRDVEDFKFMNVDQIRALPELYVITPTGGESEKKLNEQKLSDAGWTIGPRLGEPVPSRSDLPPYELHQAVKK